jgi:arylsulfatase A-like enzyme
MSGRLAAIQAFALLLACPQIETRPSESRSKAVRPGDTILERIDLLRVLAYPRSNLPPDLGEALRRPFAAAAVIRDHAAWSPETPMPAELAGRLPDPTGWKLWRATPKVVPHPGSQIRILLGDREPPGRDSVSGALPGPFAWWEEATRSVVAVASGRPPTEVRVEYTADPAGELGATELFLDAHRRDPPQPIELVRRVKREHVTRTVLLAPAGTELALELGPIEADELRIAIALDGSGFRRVRDRLQRIRRCSDGALVAVEASVAGRRQRIWSRLVAREEADAGFIEERIPLGEIAGKTTELFLVTEPGPDGDGSFDYVLLGDLTFQGPHRTPSKPHVILIDIDTLRADALSIYGCPKPTSPNLDRWAERATVYRDAIASSSWTLPATISIMTGTHVRQHGVTERGSRNIGSALMLQTMLKEAGYETWGLADGLWLQAPFGFDEGFDRYYSTFKKKMDWTPALDHVRTRRSDRPLFVFLHTYIVHAPYERDLRFEPADDPYSGPLSQLEVSDDNVLLPFERGVLELSAREREYVRNLYLAGVARMDDIFGRFLVGIEEALRGEDFMAVFTSDHGECFFEHGMMGHGHELWGELTRVPLIIRWPRGLADTPPAGFCDTPASHVDIVPTILECAGLEVPELCPGRSQLSVWEEGAHPRVAALNDWHESITDDGWRLVRRRSGGGPWRNELYDLRNDPFERHDLASSQAERVEALARLFERVHRRYPRLEGGRGPTEPIDAETLAGLRALGYGR